VLCKRTGLNCLKQVALRVRSSLTHYRRRTALIPYYRRKVSFSRALSIIMPILALALLAGAYAQVQLTVDTSVAKTVVDLFYVNYNIDTGSLYNGMNFSDTKFRTLVEQLGPAWIRIGGTAVDASYYFPEHPYNVGVPNPCDACGSGASAISNAMLMQIVDFMKATGMKLLWDFNGEGTRFSPLGPWNPAVNATPLLHWLDSYAGGTIDFAFSIGNEPDLWKIKTPAAQMGKDAVTLKRLLADYNVGQQVFGPSWAHVSAQDATDYVTQAVGHLDGYTVHNYPYGGKDCNVSKYFNKAPITQNLAASLASVVEAVHAINGGDSILLTLEEVACSSGGGCENVTDRFLAGFAWLTTLNTVAEAGFHRVHRQDIAGWSFAFGMSHYMLLGPAGWVNGSAELLTPHPDYFTTILFRQLVGQKLLFSNASGDASLLEGIDLHAWCSSPRSPAGTGGLTLTYVNFSPKDIAVALPDPLASASGTLYSLTATAQGTSLQSLQSDDMYLNGNLLTVDAEGRLPSFPLPGVPFSGGGKLTAPGFSYVSAPFPPTRTLYGPSSPPILTTPSHPPLFFFFFFSLQGFLVLNGSFGVCAAA
jgi:hypothetical protein